MRSDAKYSSAFAIRNFLQNRFNPTALKNAHTVQIYKKGVKAEVKKNYKPVSLTSVVCKDMESIIRDHHVMAYFIQNELFSSKQCKFLKGRSTVLLLLNNIDDWTFKLDAGGQIDCNIATQSDRGLRGDLQVSSALRFGLARPFRILGTVSMDCQCHCRSHMAKSQLRFSMGKSFSVGKNWVRRPWGTDVSPLTQIY